MVGAEIDRSSGSMVSLKKLQFGKLKSLKLFKLQGRANWSACLKTVKKMMKKCTSLHMDLNLGWQSDSIYNVWNSLIVNIVSDKHNKSFRWVYPHYDNRTKIGSLVSCKLLYSVYPLHPAPMYNEDILIIY